jgi:hypothetical protein
MDPPFHPHALLLTFHLLSISLTPSISPPSLSRSLSSLPPSLPLPGTVGLMTLPILGAAEGYTEEQASEPAIALGEHLTDRYSI